ncbi:MAG: hypothetical protein ACOC1G_00520 [Phycisphaeraceae bacterium]
MSHKASDSTDPDPADDVRNDDAPAAQALRGSGAADAQLEPENPCENKDCGFDGPWHCGCLCVRRMVKDDAHWEEYASDRPAQQDEDSDRHSDAA